MYKATENSTPHPVWTTYCRPAWFLHARNWRPIDSLHPSYKLNELVVRSSLISPDKVAIGQRMWKGLRVNQSAIIAHIIETFFFSIYRKFFDNASPSPALPHQLTLSWKESRRKKVWPWVIHISDLRPEKGLMPLPTTCLQCGRHNTIRLLAHALYCYQWKCVSPMNGWMHKEVLLRRISLNYCQIVQLTEWPAS